MGLGAVAENQDVPEAVAVQEPEVALKRNFPGLARIADAITQFEDVLRDFVTMADPDTAKKVTRIMSQVREVEPSVTVIGQIKAGSCWINNYNLAPSEIAFSGYRKSGIGRENSIEALRVYSQIKTVYVETGDVASPY